jgi:hypothetical protein
MGISFQEDEGTRVYLIQPPREILTRRTRSRSGLRPVPWQLKIVAGEEVAKQAPIQRRTSITIPPSHYSAITHVHDLNYLLLIYLGSELVQTVVIVIIMHPRFPQSVLSLVAPRPIPTQQCTTTQGSHKVTVVMNATRR